MFIWLKSYEVVKIIVTVMTYTLCIRNSLSFFPHSFLILDCKHINFIIHIDIELNNVKIRWTRILYKNQK